jgi:hypothetical protein
MRQLQSFELLMQRQLRMTLQRALLSAVRCTGFSGLWPDVLRSPTQAPLGL